VISNDLSFVNQRYVFGFNACWNYGNNSGDQQDKDFNAQLMTELGTQLMETYLSTCPTTVAEAAAAAAITEPGQATSVQYPNVPPACESIAPSSISVQVQDNNRNSNDSNNIQCFACEQGFHVHWLLWKEEQERGRRQLQNDDNVDKTTANTEPQYVSTVNTDAPHNEQLQGFLSSWLDSFPPRGASPSPLTSSIVFLEWVGFVNGEHAAAQDATTSTTTTDPTIAAPPVVAGALETPETVTSGDDDNNSKKGILWGSMVSLGAIVALLFVWVRRRHNRSSYIHKDTSMRDDTIGYYDDDDDDDDDENTLLEESLGVDVRGLNHTHSMTNTNRFRVPRAITTTEYYDCSSNNSHWLCHTLDNDHDTTTFCSGGGGVRNDSDAVGDQRNDGSRPIDESDTDDDPVDSPWSFYVEPLTSALTLR